MLIINQFPHRQTGFGLVELMIGLLVGMIVVAAAGSILTTTLTSSNDSIKMARLDQELRQVMTMVSRDLRRASAWDGAVDVARVSLSDPLTLSGNSGTVTLTSSKGNLDLVGTKAERGMLVYYDGTNLHKGKITAGSYNAGGESYSVVLTGTWPTETAALDGVQQGSWSILGPQPSITENGNCMLFAYDTNASGTITPDGTTAEPNEKFGYRYDATDKAVKIKTSGTATDCAATTFTGWENLTDPDTTVISDNTDFTITNNPSATIPSYGFNVGVREYTIKITGKLKSDTSVERTLTETIRVRNDELGI